MVSNLDSLKPILSSLPFHTRDEEIIPDDPLKKLDPIKIIQFLFKPNSLPKDSLKLKSRLELITNKVKSKGLELKELINLRKNVITRKKQNEKARSVINEKIEKNDGRLEQIKESLTVINQSFQEQEQALGQQRQPPFSEANIQAMRESLVRLDREQKNIENENRIFEDVLERAENLNTELEVALFNLNQKIEVRVKAINAIVSSDNVDHKDELCYMDVFLVNCSSTIISPRNHVFNKEHS